METPPPPPSSTPTAAATTSPRPPIAPSKLRLMCSYGGHIVPRPHDKSLFYAGGETRIVAVDRRSVAASLSSLSAHLSRAIFHNRPFHLKYQLPNEDLDSLISVITDEDLSNMLDEHDRIAPPARIRLFLFPVKPESIGSALLDPKSESWFCDALKSTGILQKGQSADSGLLMGIGPDLEAPVESGSNSGGGGEGKNGAESVVLETSSSFGSTGSSFSMSNSPPIGVAHCDEKGLSLLDRKIMLPSSAYIESDSSAGISAAPPKAGSFQEPLIQFGQEEPSQNPISDSSINITTQNAVQVLGYPLSQLPDGKKQHETQLIQGNLQYTPQYAGTVPISPYYPVYQMPMHPQQITCPPNQPYPIYLVPMRPSQYHNMPIQCNNPFDSNTSSPSSRPPLHPQAAVINQTVAPKEVSGAQIAESATKVYCSVPVATQLVNIPSNQGQLVMAPPEPQIASEPVTTASLASAVEGSEFDEDIAYNLIYKTQPSPPVLPSQYQTVTKGTTMLADPSAQLQPNQAKHQAALLPQ